MMPPHTKPDGSLQNRLTQTGQRSYSLCSKKQIKLMPVICWTPRAQQITQLTSFALGEGAREWHARIWHFPQVAA